MSVLIYGIDSEAKDFWTLTVSSEACFRNIWEPAINQLQLMYIGDQRWLYRKDIDKILEEFKVQLRFMFPRRIVLTWTNVRKYIRFKKY